MEIFENKALMAELCTGFQPGSSHWVHITHVNNPHSFYVRLTKYEALLKSLESQAPASNDADIQDLIVFPWNSSSDANRYARGQIFATNEDGGNFTCDVLALDYGFIQKDIPLNEISKCNESVRNIPPLAVHCQLLDCAPIGDCEWSEESIEALKFYFGNEKANMTVAGRISDKLNVKIVNSNPDDIATLMALTGFSTLGYSGRMISRLTTIAPQKKYFNFKNVIMNDTLHVRMQCGSSLKEFYVVEISDYKNYQKDKDNISNATKKEKGLSSDELVENLPVCVLNDLRVYERAIVKSYSNSKSEAIVQLVDSGKKMTAHVLNMKSIPDTYINKMAIAIYCSAEEHQIYDYNLERVLQPGYEFLITIKKLGRHFESPNIVTVTTIGKP